MHPPLTHSFSPESQCLKWCHPSSGWVSLKTPFIDQEVCFYGDALKLMKIRYHPVPEGRYSSVYFWPQTPLTSSTINIKEPSRSNGPPPAGSPTLSPACFKRLLPVPCFCIDPEQCLLPLPDCLSNLVFPLLQGFCYTQQLVPYTSGSDAYTALPATHSSCPRTAPWSFAGVSSGSQSYLMTLYLDC